MTNNERIAKEILGLVHWENFEIDLEGCFRMEEKIKEKGCGIDYINNLICVVDPECTESYGADLFSVCHASSAQRVEAAIRMLDEREGEK